MVQRFIHKKTLVKGDGGAIHVQHHYDYTLKMIRLSHTQLSVSVVACVCAAGVQVMSLSLSDASALS